MVIQNVFDHVAIVFKGISPVSWRELVFKGISGSLYTIGMGPSFRILESVAMVNGEGPLLRTLDVPQFSQSPPRTHAQFIECPLRCLFLPIFVSSISTITFHTLFEGQ
ncbi:hypothetical protein RF11_08100 [Thelohanellus kitauei]|uniref:Uncharacterized protein n=1 Tax=Thelohanellus kitauei TaxID=669202 RepID=A0A0C2IF55_THEKT|nr:hypothetical protein RF11_08100 [Thelohanellus kitauei]